MKFLPLVFLSFLAVGCTSDQQREEDVIQKDEDIQKQEEQIQKEEMNRTGASDEIGPSYQDGATSSPSPYSGSAD